MFTVSNTFSPQTMAAISMRNKIYTRSYGYDNSVVSGAFVNKPFDKLAGALSNFAPSQSRSVEPVRGIGVGDKVIELVPSYHEVWTFNAERTMFYLSNLFEVFGYRGGISGIVRALNHHKYPFDIKQELVFSEPATALSVFENLSNVKPAIGASTEHPLRALETYYLGCWITDYNTQVQTSSSNIIENCTISATDITDSDTLNRPGYLNTGNFFGDISRGIVSSASSLANDLFTNAISIPAGI